MNYPVTFLNDNTEKDLREKGLAALMSRRDDLQEFMESDEQETEELGPFNEYGLSFDNQLEEVGYWSFCLSTGGPAEEIRFYGRSGKIEFVYLDWFAGVGFDVSDDDVFEWVRDYMMEWVE